VVAAPSAPVKPKPPVVKREERKPLAPRTTAPPRSEQAAPAIAAPRAGVAVLASEMANWRGLVAAHLRRYQQYPPGARARHEEGAVSMNFAVDRNGHVLSRHIVHGSGFADLDAEVLAMIERAQPLPAFPPSMTQSRADLTVPVRFSLR
jgi:protein TonB